MAADDTSCTHSAKRRARGVEGIYKSCWSYSQPTPEEMSLTRAAWFALRAFVIRVGRVARLRVCGRGQQAYSVNVCEQRQCEHRCGIFSDVDRTLSYDV